MRVLVVSGQSAGGIWHYAFSLAEALAAAREEVAMAVPFPFEQIDGKNDIRIWQVGTRAVDVSTLPIYSPRRGINHLYKLRELHRVIVGFRPNIVHFHDRFGQLDFAYLRLLKGLGMRIVYTAHDVRSLFGKSTWFDRARYRQADAVLAHSSNSVSELVNDGVKESKITLLPHANYLRFVDTSRMPSSSAKDAFGIPPNGRLVLFFGSIAPYKGLSILIDAVAQLRQQNPRVFLLIAGNPKESFEPYRRQIEISQLGKHVITDLRYIPFDEFGRFFLAADVVALPYRRIYQSGVLQLAYAFGRPLVVTDVGGLGETVVDDCTGLVAQTADAHGIASAIRALLSDPVGAKEMGERGRRLAVTKYSWDAVARQVVEVYRSLSATSPSSCECRTGVDAPDRQEEG